MIRTRAGLHAARPVFCSVSEVRMSEDISPSSQPFSTRISEYLAGLRVQNIDVDAALLVHDYVDLAKRSLLEHRVRDFTAADVVALAAMMEARDRAMEGRK